MASLARATWLRLSSAWSTQWHGRGAAWALELVIISCMVLLIAAATPIGAHIGSMSPHPLWIPVLLISTQYGTAAGLAAAVASMALHWITGAPPQAGGEDIYDYLNRAWREPLLWPVAAVVLGGFHARQAQATEALRARLVEADAQRRAIGSHAEALRSHCDALERRMACAADRSIEAGLAALDDVGVADRDDLKRALSRAMDLLVGPASYQVLTLRDGELRTDTRLSCASDEMCRLPRMDHLPAALELELARGRKLLSIRSAEAVDKLAGAALIASPILSPGGERLIGALLIQAMDPNRLTVEVERSVHALCRELSRSLSRDPFARNFTRQRPSPSRLVSLPGGAMSSAR